LGRAKRSPQLRKLGVRAGCEALRKSKAVPDDMRAELAAYAEGVNASVNRIGDKGLPAFFKLLAYKPEPWSAPN